MHESAALQLEFRQVVLPGGAAYPITAHLTGVDNARERVDRNGKIHGIRATDTLANRFGERTLFALTAHPAAMVPLLLFESGMLHFPDPEIEFPRGTALQLTVEFPPPFEDVAPCALPQAEESPEQRTAMQEAVNGLPYWSYSKRHRQPMDLVNLLFLGSREEVERAFQAAGWSGSRDNSVRAGVAAMRAIAEDEAYADAPMRTLLLDGREPDLRLQKSLDTFEKRDHLRVWKRAGELDGSAVWASAATRDLGATFGMHPFGFTHQIQDDVDLERDKVVHDLLFTGCVDSVAYLARPEGVRESGQVYRRGVSTDARVAVVRLNPCTQAREDFSTVEPLAQPGGAVRVIRRVTLTARNHILRDNLVYRSADAARLGFLVLRNLDRQAMREKRARDEDAKREASGTMVRR